MQMHTKYRQVVSTVVQLNNSVMFVEPTSINLAHDANAEI